MKTETSLKLERRTIRGRRMVLLPEAAFDELVRRADLSEPPLPDADDEGNRPADAYAAVSQARDILRARRKLGLSQAELARSAGIRPETLNRIEQGRHKPSVPTITKIDKALRRAEADSARQGTRLPG